MCLRISGICLTRRVRGILKSLQIIAGFPQHCVISQLLSWTCTVQFSSCFSFGHESQRSCGVITGGASVAYQTPLMLEVELKNYIGQQLMKLVISFWCLMTFIYCQIDWPTWWVAWESLVSRASCHSLLWTVSSEAEEEIKLIKQLKNHLF